MAEPVDLASLRWAKSADPRKFPPADALRAVLRAIDSGEINPEHVIVCVALLPEGDNRAQTRTYQSGPFGHYAQLGLMDHARAILGGPEE